MCWKDRFVELILNNKADSYGEALELKRRNIPKKLYRFRDLSPCSVKYRIKEIEGELYLAQPTTLNDPFEARPMLSSKNASSYFSMGSKENYKKSMLNYLNAEEIENFFSSDDWFDKFMDFMTEKIAEDVKLTQEQVKKDFNDVIMKEMELLNQTYQSILETYRIACFSEELENLPMWAHYADEHTGICFEYNTDNIKNKDILMINRMFPVSYVDKLPDFMLNAFGIKKENASFTILDYYLTQKTNDWAYEKEWRLLYLIGNFYYSPDLVPEDYYKKGQIINFISPSKVYLGSKINDDNQAKILEVAKRLNIIVEKMIITSYGLESIAVN